MFLFSIFLLYTIYFIQQCQEQHSWWLRNLPLQSPWLSFWVRVSKLGNKRAGQSLIPFMNLNIRSIKKIMKYIPVESHQFLVILWGWHTPCRIRTGRRVPLRSCFRFRWIIILTQILIKLSRISNIVLKEYHYQSFGLIVTEKEKLLVSTLLMPCTGDKEEQRC